MDYPLCGCGNKVTSFCTEAKCLTRFFCQKCKGTHYHANVMDFSSWISSKLPEEVMKQQKGMAKEFWDIQEAVNSRTSQMKEANLMLQGIFKTFLPFYLDQIKQLINRVMFLLKVNIGRLSDSNQMIKGELEQLESAEKFILENIGQARGKITPFSGNPKQEFPSERDLITKSEVILHISDGMDCQGGDSSMSEPVNLQKTTSYVVKGLEEVPGEDLDFLQKLNNVYKKKVESIEEEMKVLEHSVQFVNFEKLVEKSQKITFNTLASSFESIYGALSSELNIEGSIKTLRDSIRSKKKRGIYKSRVIVSPLISPGLSTPNPKEEKSLESFQVESSTSIVDYILGDNEKCPNKTNVGTLNTILEEEPPLFKEIKPSPIVPRNDFFTSKGVFNFTLSAMEDLTILETSPEKNTTGIEIDVPVPQVQKFQSLRESKGAIMACENVLKSQTYPEIPQSEDKAMDASTENNADSNKASRSSFVPPKLGVLKKGHKMFSSMKRSITQKEEDKEIELSKCGNKSFNGEIVGDSSLEIESPRNIKKKTSFSKNSLQILDFIVEDKESQNSFLILETGSNNKDSPDQTKKILPQKQISKEELLKPIQKDPLKRAIQKTEPVKPIQNQEETNKNEKIEEEQKPKPNEEIPKPLLSEPQKTENHLAENNSPPQKKILLKSRGGRRGNLFPVSKDEIKKPPRPDNPEPIVAPKIESIEQIITQRENEPEESKSKMVEETADKKHKNCETLVLLSSSEKLLLFVSENGFTQQPFSIDKEESDLTCVVFIGKQWLPSNSVNPIAILAFEALNVTNNALHVYDVKEKMTVLIRDNCHESTIMALFILDVWEFSNDPSPMDTGPNEYKPSLESEGMAVKNGGNCSYKVNFVSGSLEPYFKQWEFTKKEDKCILVLLNSIKLDVGGVLGLIRVEKSAFNLIGVTAGSSKRCICFWQANRKELRSVHIIDDAHREKINTISNIDNDRFCTGGSDGMVKIWALGSLSVEKTLNNEAPVWSCQGLGHNYLATTVNDLKLKSYLVKIWDIKAGSVTSIVSDHKSRISSLDLLGPSCLLSLDKGHVLMMWRIQKVAQTGQVMLEKIKGRPPFVRSGSKTGSMRELKKVNPLKKASSRLLKI